MLHNMNIFLLVWLMGVKICHNVFIGSQTFDGSHICFRVCAGVWIVSHDMTGCGMMWNSIQLCSSRIHVCLGLMFTCDSLNHGFT